jgi:heat-inducible transcriptional repressor
MEGVDRLEHVHFSRLAPGRVLAVVVTQSGLVRDRVLALEGIAAGELTARDLETSGAFLNQHFRGWSIESIRAEIGRTLERERAEYQALLALRRSAADGDSIGIVEQLWAGAVPDSTGPVQTIAIEGVSNLLGPGGGSDIGRLRDVLAALEAKERLIGLLNAYMDARQTSVRVVFDLEEQAPELAGLVLIAAPARMAGEGRGTLAVLGQKRMQYGTTLHAVACAAEIFERLLHPNA